MPDTAWEGTHGPPPRHRLSHGTAHSVPILALPSRNDRPLPPLALRAAVWFRRHTAAKAETTARLVPWRQRRRNPSAAASRRRLPRAAPGLGVRRLQLD